MASQSKSEMARLLGQFFNNNDPVVFSDFPEACEQNFWPMHKRIDALPK